MNIHRVHLQENFITLPNALVQNKQLSFRARGILVMMLSMPLQWQTYHSWITEQGTEGDDAVRTALRELEAAGYLTKRQKRKRGKMAGLQWDWYAIPIPKEQRTCYRKPPTGTGKSDSGSFGADEAATIKDTAYKIRNLESLTPSIAPSESKASEVPAFHSETQGLSLLPSVPAIWKPKLISTLSRDAQLAALPNAVDYPSEEEFDDFLSEEDFICIPHTRPDLYGYLCQCKWRKWDEKARKWVPLYDWRAFVRALETTIAEAMDMLD